jgi:hypothetical protein
VSSAWQKHQLNLTEKQKRASQKTTLYNFHITFALYFIKEYDMERRDFLKIAAATTLTMMASSRRCGKYFR